MIELLCQCFLRFWYTSTVSRRNQDEKQWKVMFSCWSKSLATSDDYFIWNTTPGFYSSYFLLLSSMTLSPLALPATQLASLIWQSSTNVWYGKYRMSDNKRRGILLDPSWSWNSADIGLCAWTVPLTIPRLNKCVQSSHLFHDNHHQGKTDVHQYFLPSRLRPGNVWRSSVYVLQHMHPAVNLWRTGRQPM